MSERNEATVPNGDPRLPRYVDDASWTQGRGGDVEHVCIDAIVDHDGARLDGDVEGSDLGEPPAIEVAPAQDVDPAG